MKMQSNLTAVVDIAQTVAQKLNVETVKVSYALSSCALTKQSLIRTSFYNEGIGWLVSFSRLPWHTQGGSGFCMSLFHQSSNLRARMLLD